MSRFYSVFIFILFLFLFSSSTYALTYNKTFSFPSDAESFSGTGTKTTFSYDSGTGNPFGSLKSDSSGRNNNDTSNWTWSGTWENLGVPTGATVTDIRVDAGYTRVTAWNVVDSVTIGPYKLRDSLDADQATLWSGRTPTGTDGSWVSIGTQSDQSVPSAIQASTSNIKLYLERSIDLGNNPSAQVTLYEDELSFVITYTIPVSITISTNGSVAFGTMGLNSTQDTTASGINDVETISVDTGPVDLDVRSSVFSEGGNSWTFGTSNGSDQAKWEFSPNGSFWTTFALADTLYSLATNVSQSATQNMYLRITTPTSTTSYGQYSSTVTIVATTP